MRCETGDAALPVTVDMRQCRISADAYPSAARSRKIAMQQAANESGAFQRYNLLSALKTRGVRLTAQRRALIETIQSATKHLDAADLLALARERDPRINRATVYRTIDLLKRLGMIDELDLMHMEGEKHYFEVKTRRDHLHLACFGCGEIREFTTSTFDRLKAEIGLKNEFEVQVIRLEVGGLCKHCAAHRKALVRKPGV